MPYFKCQYCHKKYYNKNKGTKYCSRKCYFKTLHISGADPQKPCANCGKPIGKDKRERENNYCSHECAYQHRSVLAKKRIREESYRTPFVDKLPEIWSDKCLLFSDPHCPRHNPDWFDFMIDKIIEEKIKVAVCIGDLIDFDELSNYLRIREGLTPLESIKSGCEVAMALVKCLRELHILLGNHDVRLARRLAQGQIEAPFKFMDETVRGFLKSKRIHYHLHTNMTLHTKKGDYKLFHPDEYRKRTTPNVEAELCTKYHTHCVGTHGHLAALKFDISSKFLACQIGTMCDWRKMEYKYEKITTHPNWQNAFAIVRNGELQLYVDHPAYRN